MTPPSPAPRKRPGRPEPKGIALLGSTGSIGQQTLEVVAHHPKRFRVAALSANRNIEKLAEQARLFRPELVVVSEPADAKLLSSLLPPEGPRVGVGLEGLIEAASLPSVHTVVTALVGASGLLPTLFAVKSGKTVAIANKETLVMAGGLVTAAAREAGVALLPVDSEHSAVWQCLAGRDATRDVRRIYLTATGGPFRGRTKAQLVDVTPEEALRHPIWKMGRKVTVDSATMMNKGLEIIEARWLFDVPVDKIEVLLHPQGIVHSLVEFVDGSVLAQLGAPDMRLPIHVALTHPDRIESPAKSLSPADFAKLEFGRPDAQTFRCLTLAVLAGRDGGTLPAVLNAANEVAVQLFLERRLSFLDIPRVIEDTLSRHRRVADPTLEEILDADRWGRDEALRLSGAGAAA